MMDELVRLLSVGFVCLIIGALISYPFGHHFGYKKGYETKSTELNIEKIINSGLCQEMLHCENVKTLEEIERMLQQLNGDDQRPPAAAAATVVVSHKEPIMDVD